MLEQNSKMNSQSVPSNFEFKDVPTIAEVINLIDQAGHWPDKLVEIELWSHLAVLAAKYNQTDNLRYCHSKALEQVSYFEKIKNDNK
jgi:hypothetical protein